LVDHHIENTTVSSSPSFDYFCSHLIQQIDFAPPTRNERIRKMDETIILTLTPHPKWGFILQPVVVQEEEMGWLSIREVAEKNSSILARMNEASKDLMEIYSRYSDQKLMKSYSKEKNISQFYQTVQPETIERFIRPCIESNHRKIIQLLPATGMSFYLRKSVKDRTLHEQDKLYVLQETANAVFHFVKDPDAGLRYSIRIQSGERNEISLYGKKNYVVCQEPAVLVVDNQVLVFNDIDSKKLIPFFVKHHIDIPASSEANYMKTFILNCLVKYTVRTEGLNIRAIEPAKRATLTLENDWNNVPVLLVALYYGQKKVPLDQPYKKNVWIDESTEGVSLSWLYPDKQWEEELTSLLLNNGLVKSGLSHFALPRNQGIESNAEDMPNLIDWIREHVAVLDSFEFSQNLPNLHYFTGEIALQNTTTVGQDWFDLNCMVVFGPFRIPFANFRQHLLDNIREYVLPDGSIAILPKEWFSKYYELALFGKKNGDSLRLKRAHYRLLEEMESDSPSATGFSFDPDKLIPIPPALQTQLRSYQQIGFSWLVHLYKNHFGACLADDMGLGKTVQTIAMLQHLVGEGDLPSLIVMPTSLLHNWQNEFRRFAPTLKIYAYSGAKRVRSNDIHLIFRHYDVILTTYGILRNDIEFFQDCPFRHLILDESQYVKNPGSLAHLSVKKVQAENHIALTGTPIENSLSDLWALFHLVNEGLLGSQSTFRKAYLNPISKNSPEKEASLLNLIQPFILRRTKEAVTPELPPLLEETVYCDMTEQQQDSYTTEKNKLRNKLLEQTTTVMSSQMAFTALQGLTRLRLLANHPILFENSYNGDSGKFEQIIMRFETILSGNHKVLIFSSFVKHLRILANRFEEENWKYAWLSGSTPAEDREKEIRKFSEEPDTHCFFISLKAGGVGLNLTAADYVFIIDPWWNPASEMQALSRAHRIGQDKNVMVYRFISSETIEEKIRQMQETKAQLAETFITSSNPMAQLSRTKLEDLLE